MVCFASISYGQSRQKTLQISSDTIQIDTLSISPVGFSLAGLDSADYKIDFASGKLILFDNTKINNQEVSVVYNVFQFDFDKEYFNKDYDKFVIKANQTSNPFIYKAENDKFTLIDDHQLQKMGSISRGMTFGNNQDLSVNSNLNLQLSGRVAENLNVVAAITDDNIPIQPDGSTNQLQDFDKVYIQLYNNNNKIIVGDFQTKYDGGNYMRYFKKATGGLYENKYAVKKQNGDSIGQLSSTAGVSMSRGKYARNIFFGTEGNQGPYRLHGSNNERFIVILSGTEVVYINGKKLKRGQEFDYVMDYNTAEITFTANQLITKDKRIIVEFQYTDKNYARSIVQVHEELMLSKTTVRFNLFSEQDGKNQPLLQQLSDAQINKLKEVGDSIQEAYASSAVPTPYSEDAVLYMLRKDTLSGDSVFVFTTNSNDSLYKVSFSYVGEGMGRYIISNTISNGKVFEWVGKGKGSYEPVVLLAAPEKRQMITLGIKQQITKTTDIDVEAALSNRDVNTFSKINNEDNIGDAVNAVITNNKNIGESSTFTTKAYYEMVSGRFYYIERFRSVEFYRDWNLRNVDVLDLQNRAGGTISFSKKGFGKVDLDVGTYNIKDKFFGLKNDLIVKSIHKSLFVDAKASLLTTDGYGEKTTFFRVKSHIIKPLWLLNAGFVNDLEHNKRVNSNTDRLNNLSYSFNEWGAYLQSKDTTNSSAKVTYIQRNDFSPKNDAYRDSTYAKNLSLELRWFKDPRHTFRSITSYRTLTVADTSIKGVKADSTLLNRIEYGARLLKGALTLNSFYEVGSGLEIKKEFTFIKVPTGQGLYVHNDNNDNGLKELDEFELAPQNLLYMADYIKVFVPTNDYVKTYKNQFNQTITIRPKAYWRNEKGIKDFAGRFIEQFAFKLDRKTNQKFAQETYNPFVFDIPDSMLVSQSMSMRNVLSFNRSSTKFGIDYIIQKANDKTLLTNGFEQRKKSFFELKPRWNISRKFLLNLTYGQGEKVLSSDYFINRNYDVNYFETESKITYQPNVNFRVAMLYNYSNKLNNSLTAEKALINKAGLQTKINIAEKGAVVAEVNYLLINYPYQTNSALSFEMLEGLSPGNNATWFISFQRTLANNLQINLNYNGRWSETSKIVHVGGIQARAFF